jgi:hypothetical protein
MFPNSSGPKAQFGTTVGVATPTISSWDLSSASEAFGAVNNCHVYAVALLLGRETTTPAYARLMRGRSFSRESGTVANIDDNAIVLGTDKISAALSGVTADLDFSGTTIRSRPTGVTGLTINWTGYLWLFVMSAPAVLVNGTGGSPPPTLDEDVLLIIGASNQTPRTSTSGLAAKYLTPGGLYAYDTDGIAGHQVSSWTATGPVSSRFAQELPLAYEFVQAGRFPRIINFARGDTTFKTDWLEGDEFLAQALTFFQDQIALIPGGTSYAVRAIYAGFGASDGETQANADVFADSLDTAQTMVQAVFPGLPFLINQLHNQISASVTYASTIRSQILAWQAASPSDRLVTNIDNAAGPEPGNTNYTNGGQFYMNPPGPALSGDDLHYTASGQVYLGTADAYQAFLYLL